eukprot:Partr_v1_DN27222_c0_g1_i1_m39166 putative t-complex 11
MENPISPSKSSHKSNSMAVGSNDAYLPSPKSAPRRNSHDYFDVLALKWQPALGVLLKHSASSISYFLPLEDASSDHSNDHVLTFRPPPRKHMAVVTARVDLFTRLDKASGRYNSRISQRISSLKLKHDRVKDITARRRHHVSSLSSPAKSRMDLSIKSAHLQRQMMLAQLWAKCSSSKERKANLHKLKRLKRFVDIRRSYSTSFLDYLHGVDVDTSSLFVRNTMGVPASTATFVHVSPTSPALMARPVSTVADKLPIVEAVSQVDITAPDPVKKSKSVTFPQTIDEKKEQALYFTDLATVFGDNMPTITRATLKELNLDTITSNAQLRHDMIFDPNLEFRANDEGEKGEMKKARAHVFWSHIENDVAGRNSRNKQPSFKRLPVLINEIKEILLELVATEDFRRGLEERVDIVLIAQQLEYNVFDAEPLITYLADIMKSHCAPVRDAAIDAMLQNCKSGNFVGCIRECFDILEKMKLDVANDQLRRLRPFVVDNAVEYEWELFKDRLRNGSTGLQQTLRWLRPHIEKAASSENVPAADLFCDAFLDLVVQWGKRNKDDPNTTQLPETFAMDISRFSTYFNDWQDMTIMTCLLLAFKQACNQMAQPDAMSALKKSLWVLLNDSDTTMTHIMLHLSATASTVRGSPLSKYEEDVMMNLIDKTLSPDSQLYELMNKRIGAQLSTYLKTKSLQPEAELIKSGLFEMVDELLELAEKMRVLLEHNKAVYQKVYNQIIAAQTQKRIPT